MPRRNRRFLSRYKGIGSAGWARAQPRGGAKQASLGQPSISGCRGDVEGGSSRTDGVCLAEEVDVPSPLALYLLLERRDEADEDSMEWAAWIDGGVGGLFASVADLPRRIPAIAIPRRIPAIAIATRCVFACLPVVIALW